MIRLARAIVQGLRLALTPERLGEPERAPSAPASPVAHGVLHVLFVSREPLGTDPEPPPRPRRSLLRSLFALEELPRDPEPPAASRRRGRLATLFAVEKLDDSP